MSRVRVKICGVRSCEDAMAALDAGADAIGFNFWPQSPRYIAPWAATEIIAKIPPLMGCVGVFVNERPDKIADAVRDTGIDAVQLHGDESPDFCMQLAAITPGSVRLIKALRVGAEFDPGRVKEYPVNAILLDANLAGSYGGTGRVFDWSLAIETKRFAPVILAGGLTIENVRSAVSEVRPLAVDVCSGVESQPGVKDIVKLREFMVAVELANAAMSIDSKAEGMELGGLNG